MDEQERGSKAVEEGQKNENKYDQCLIDFGLIEVDKSIDGNCDIFSKNPSFISNNKKNARSDTKLFGIHIEYKHQDVPGSVDQKLDYYINNLRYGRYPHDTLVLVLDGSELLTEGIKQYLETVVKPDLANSNKTLITIYSYDEFIDYAMNQIEKNKHLPPYIPKTKNIKHNKSVIVEYVMVNQRTGVIMEKEKFAEEVEKETGSRQSLKGPGLIKKLNGDDWKKVLKECLNTQSLSSNGQAGNTNS